MSDSSTRHEEGYMPRIMNSHSPAPLHLLPRLALEGVVEYAHGLLRSSCAADDIWRFA